MKRIISVLVAVSMVVAVSASGFTAPAPRVQTTADFLLRKRLTDQKKLPAGAGSRLTPELQQAWDSLSEEEQKVLLVEFANIIGPALQKAITEHDNTYGNSQPESDQFVLDPSMMLPPPPGNDPPIVSMTAAPSRGPAPLTVTFQASAVDIDGTIESYSWIFGDGQTSSSPITVLHTYQTPGTYQARVTVYDDTGGSATAARTITVTSGTNQPPRVLPAVSPAMGPAPLTVNFTANASDPDGQVVSYNWAFGDGQTSSQANPSHTYQSPGNYTATITITDNGGQTTSGTLLVAATNGGGNQPPQVSFTASPFSGAAPITINFTSNASDPDGVVVSYSWTFGDGQTSSQANPSHTYQSPGNYTPTLVVTDNVGATGSATTTINITNGGSNQPPQVSITASPTSGPAPLTINFTGNASDPDGVVVSYSWTFGDGQTSSQANPSHTYQTSGSYTIGLTVMDNSGATASASIGISVSNPIVVDIDQDGLPDTLENQLANSFTPRYFVSTGEKSGTGLATFQNRSDQQVVSQVFPTSPPTVISYYRVTPLRILAGQGYLQIDYLTLWNRDDGGSYSGSCNTFLAILSGLAGISVTQLVRALSAHNIDNERSRALVVAPTVGGNYNTNLDAYRLDTLVTAAHEDTFVDRSSTITFVPPASPPFHLSLALSRSKHGTYPFNPDGVVLLLPPFMIDAIYFAVFSFCLHCSVFPRPLCAIRCELLLLLADTLVFSCFVERFGNQGETLAQTRINVGELAHPINASRFIQSPDVSAKLQKLFP